MKTKTLCLALLAIYSIPSVLAIVAYLDPNAEDGAGGCSSIAPCKTFAFLYAVVPSVTRIHLRRGTFEESFVLENGVDIIGGFDEKWQLPESNVPLTTIKGTDRNGEAITFSCVNVNNVFISNVRLIGPDAEDYYSDTGKDGKSSYIGHLSGCQNIGFANVYFDQGRGKTGARGSDGAIVAGAEPEKSGTVGDDAGECSDIGGASYCPFCCNDNRVDGAPTTVAFSGTNGGSGGLGGRMDGSCCSLTQLAAQSGTNGATGLSDGWGSGGSRGSGGSACGNNVGHGGNGVDGSVVAIGVTSSAADPTFSSGDGGQLISGGLWRGYAGSDGLEGGAGGGGGGGGGGGACDSYSDDSGAGGGSGGAGGVGGLAGSGGGAGGSSFGLFVIDSTVSVGQNCVFWRQTAGDGGNGGDGSAGQEGGIGGAGGAQFDSGGRGGTGGDGAHGVHGGAGSGGSGGLSVGIFAVDTATPPLTSVTYVAVSGEQTFNSGIGGNRGCLGASAPDRPDGSPGGCAVTEGSLGTGYDGEVLDHVSVGGSNLVTSGACIGLDCGLNGICKFSSCDCLDGFSGPNCDIATCSPGCVNGVCGDSLLCVCDEGYEGPLCQYLACLPEPCGEHGVCPGDEGTCICDEGWEGDGCKTPICDGANECTPTQICLEPGVCGCADGYYDVAGECLPICERPPCSENGVCVAPDVCQCVGDFTGAACNVPCPEEGCDYVAPEETPLSEVNFEPTAAGAGAAVAGLGLAALLAYNPKPKRSGYSKVGGSKKNRDPSASMADGKVFSLATKDLAPPPAGPPARSAAYNSTRRSGNASLTRNGSFVSHASGATRSSGR